MSKTLSRQGRPSVGQAGCHLNTGPRGTGCTPVTRPPESRQRDKLCEESPVGGGSVYQTPRFRCLHLLSNGCQRPRAGSSDACAKPPASGCERAGCPRHSSHSSVTPDGSEPPRTRPISSDRAGARGPAASCGVEHVFHLVPPGSCPGPGFQPLWVPWLWLSFHPWLCEFPPLKCVWVLLPFHLSHSLPRIS